jgi:hypothetical protein
MLPARRGYLSLNRENNIVSREIEGSEEKPDYSADTSISALEWILRVMSSSF